MPTDQIYIDRLLERIQGAGTITTKKMMGECLFYVDGKYTALLSDNELFVKPTLAGKNFLGAVTEKPPYPGAKPAFLIDKWDDSVWLCELLLLTAAELPAPKPKTQKK